MENVSEIPYWLVKCSPVHAPSVPTTVDPLKPDPADFQACLIDFPG